MTSFGRAGILILMLAAPLAMAKDLKGATAHPKTSAPATVPAYRVGPGDVLAISVWQEKHLNKDVLVAPDGTISFPLAGTVQVGGSTVSQIRHKLTQKLKPYIPGPTVNVSLQKAINNRIYVIGDVNKPGTFVSPGYLDVLQALSMAGGLTPFAAENDITILRRENGKQKVFRFYYAQVKDGEHLKQDILLQPGDVVVVPGGWW
ncbi:MAG: polysaccharide biosynthesis/export family protein [Acidiferrobacteraceae bacterium]